MSDVNRDRWYRFLNRLMRFVYNEHFGYVWRFIQRVEFLERFVNRLLVNTGVNVVMARPYRLSTKSSYTSWDSLTDRTYNARELPAAPGDRRTTPDAQSVVTLFERREFIEDPKSTVMFAYVAQWFTDGFLRSDRSVKDATKRDIRRNESSHEVDLAQLYGLTNEITTMLTDRSDTALLAHQVIRGEEFPPNLYDANGQRVEQFKDLPVIGLDQPGVDKTQLLAMGSDTSNTQIGYAMINTLMLREHNRIARAIRAANPSWENGRVFTAARNVLNVVFIKVLIEEYIHHISPYQFHFKFDPQGFERSRWHRPNWVAVEFNILYRWHSLIPPTFRIDGQDMDLAQTTMYKTKSLLTARGLGPLFNDASKQAAGKICLQNTGDPLLWRAELPTIEEARDVQLRSYNDYLTRYHFPRARTYADITSDREVAAALEKVYGPNVDDVEFYVGLFAGDIPKYSMLSPLMERMLAIHAFSQLMTHPLLSPQVYNSETFSALGLEMIEATSSFKQIVDRNVPAGSPDFFVSLTREGWRR